MISALAANAALKAVTSGESELEPKVVVGAGASVVVGEVVVDETAVDVLVGATVVDEVAPSTVASSPPPPSAEEQAEATRTRIANIVVNRLVMESLTSLNARQISDLHRHVLELT
jgi:Ni,Fe-hydrogenase III small subunit